MSRATARIERRRALGLAVLFVLAVTAAFLLPHWGVLTPDTKPELYLNTDRMLARELSAWRSVPALGSPNYHPGIAPITAVVLALQSIGVEPWLSQRVLAVALVVGGAVSTTLLVREVGGRRGWTAPTIAGIAYALHPYAVVAGATLPIRLPHAVLPLFALLSLRALARPGARWPAAAAVAYAAMGGINGGIVNLFLFLALPVVGVVACRTMQVPVRTAVRRGVLVAGLCLLVSLYWVVPTLLAAGSTGVDVAASTEAPRAVAATSSPVESLRGLGLWTLYLVIGGRPEVPGHVAYLTSVLAIAGSLALVVVAALGAVVADARTRLLAAALVVVALPLMVGLHPPDRTSPFGRALAWAYQHVPGAIGFRTPNKAGSLLALGIALLVGVAAAGRWRGRALTPAVVALVVLGSLPVWVGHAQPVVLDVPPYWRAAATALDTPDPGRLLFAPGGFLARYDWGYAGVDDLDTALFDQREVVWRPTVPAGSRPAHNLLTAFDVGMNDAAVGPAAARAHLALLGVSEVLVRADSVNPVDGAATATDLLATYTSIDGAEVTATWGPRRVQSPPLLPPSAPAPALTAVRVPATPDPAQVAPVRGGLVLTGDAFAIGALAEAGYAPERRALSWLDRLSDDELVAQLRAGGRLVLTDTNQRRRWDVRGVGRSHSIVLAADTPVAPAETRVRSLAVTDQTTAMVAGGVGVTSSDDVPELFRVDAARPATFAVDGDPTTSWLTGPFGTETDSWIEVDYGAPLPLDQVRVEVDTTLDRVPSRLRILAEDTEVVTDVPNDGIVSLGLPGQSDRLRVEVVRARGEGAGPVGIRDVSLAARTLRAGLALPTSLAARDARPVRDAVAAAPLDIVLTRLQGDPATSLDDEERALFREFAVPDDRRMAMTAVVRPTDPPGHLVDRVAHRGTRARVVSPEDTTFGALGRATQAFDGDRRTAWAPKGAAGSMLVELPRPTRLRELVVRRDRDAGPAVLRVRAGEVTREVPLVGPRTRIRLPRPVRTRSLHLTVVAPGLRGDVPPIAEVEVPGVRTTPITPRTRLTGCVDLGRMDAIPVWVHVDATLQRLVGGRPLAVSGCDPVPLGAGLHRYDSGFRWAVDSLVLQSAAADRPAPRGALATPGTAGTVEVLAASATARHLRVDAAEPVLLSTGIAFDPRWAATVDGRDLGPPRLAAGYAVGWPLPAGTHDVVVTYTVQRWVTAGFVASTAVLAGLLAVVALARERPR